MSRIRYLCACVMGFVCSVAQASEIDLQRFEAYLDGVMAAQFRDYELAGMTFSLVVDGERVLSRGYGYADLETRTPVVPERHLFRPGSVSKLFTWTALMQLVEQGLIDLDTPVREYVPEIEIPDTFGVPLTLTHIMTHSPGFEDGAAGYLFADEESDLVPLVESLAAHVPDQIWPPGTYSAYNNFAVALAGLVIANVSGLSFEDYVAEHIFKPLGMQRSTFEEPLPPSLAADFATGYVSEQGALEAFGFEFIKNFGPAGALSATADDMARFIVAHVREGEFGESSILRPETVQRMHSRLFAHHPKVAGMAHGFYEIRRNGERFVGHGGDTIAFHSELVIKPEDEFGFFVSFNAADGGQARTAVTDSVIEFFYPGDGGQHPEFPSEPLPGAAERIAEIAGAYRFNRRSFTALEGALGLAGDLTVVPADAPGQLYIPAPIVGGRFVEVEPWVFRKQGRQELLVFETDEDGAVTRAFVGSLPIMVGDKLSFLTQASTHQMVIGLALLAALFVVINGLRSTSRSRQLTGAVRLAHRAVLANAWIIIFFMVGLSVVFADADMNKLLFEFPPPGTGLVLVLPILSVIVGTLGVAMLFPVWRSDVCNIWQKLRYTYVASVFFLLLFVLWYWNLIGWNY